MSLNGHTPNEELQPVGYAYGPTASAAPLRLVNPASLQPHPDNYNLHPPEQITELKASLTQFSQVKNVVTWRGLILAGHGLVTAALEAGLTEIEARDVSEWPPEKAVAYLVADNETARMGQPDYARLQGLVNQARAAGVVVPGVSGERLEEIAREVALLRGEVVDDPLAEWKGMPGFEQEDLGAFRSIHVHFKTQEDVETFAKLISQGLSENTRSIWFPEAEKVDMTDVYINES